MCAMALLCRTVNRYSACPPCSLSTSPSELCTLLPHHALKAWLDSGQRCALWSPCYSGTIVPPCQYHSAAMTPLLDVGPHHICQAAQLHASRSTRPRSVSCRACSAMSCALGTRACSYRGTLRGTACQNLVRFDRGVRALLAIPAFRATVPGPAGI
ncbi:hypothetical protein C8J57DRAFT_316203 [Mycena rebaudengoi]|nr:hypothetical protein C8J57DRAFT_316203 [Mycena rebaudengoi]